MQRKNCNNRESGHCIPAWNKPLMESVAAVQ